jgi:Fe-S-cluster-containing dehydrogenase component
VVVATLAASPVPQLPSTGPAGTPMGTPTAAGGPVELPGVESVEPMGFYTDTTVCIGCKACEVACKNWNGLSSSHGGANTISGDSYDNTRHLDGQHWRHVKFIEQFSPETNEGRWLMMSDVCKHCVHAGCLEVCPTGRSSGRSSTRS